MAQNIIPPETLLSLIKDLSVADPSGFAREYLTEYGIDGSESGELHINSKTIFANPLAISVRIDHLAASLTATSSNDQAIRQLTDARMKLERTVTNETKCGGCPHMDIAVEDYKNMVTDVTEYRLRTVCVRGKKAATTNVVCPDGTITAKDGRVMQRVVEPMIYLPPPEQTKPDLPTTDTGDTAW